MTAAQLTARQQQFLDAVTQHFQEEQCPPSTRELCERLNISSPNGITNHKRALERKGLIRIVGKSRRIALVGKCACCGK